MKPVIFTGRANLPLAEGVAIALGTELAPAVMENFPDGELHVVLEAEVAGKDVYLLQSTTAPVAEHLLEILLLADACRRDRAERITAVMPYFGYARQDRRTGPGEPVSSKVVANMLSPHVDQIIGLDIHNPIIEGFFSVPVEMLSAVPQLAKALRRHREEEQVIVAPDQGAVKLAHRYAKTMNLSVASIHKVRSAADTVAALKITGEVCNKRPVIVDDMIATGGTLLEATRILLEKGAVPPVTIVVSHALLTDNATEKLAGLPLDRLLITDSVIPAHTGDLPIERISVAGLLADAISRLHTTTGNDDRS